MPDTSSYETRYSLIHRLRSTDDKQAWEDFLNHYEPFIFFLLHKMNINLSDQEDLRQDIMVKLYTKLESYSQDQGTFRTWLSTVIRNTTLNYIRKRQRAEQVTFAIEKINNYETPELESIIQKQWQEYVIELAFERLSEVFQPNIINCYKMTLENRNAEDIAKELNIELGTVYTLRKRFKARLAAEIRQITRDLEF